MPLPHGKRKGAAIFDQDYDWPADAIAWAAGFYEGEGAVGERSVVVSQVNRWPLERLMTVFGGYIGSARRDRRYRTQDIWQWSLCGDRGRKFIDAIYPHLSPKRQGQIDARFMTTAKFRLHRVVMSQQASERAKAANRLRVRNAVGRFV